ncbi:MAG: NADH-quinone oxidoreductase subunit L, partial [Sphingobacteriales bacterium]
IYSAGYMHDDAGFGKFFAYLNLFCFFMLVLVLGSNYVVLFIGWEGVGLCSFLLIGFWNKVHAYNEAAKKAFVMNRIGDLAFLLGIFWLFFEFGTVEFVPLFEKVATLNIGAPVIFGISLLLFIGATGKSAQIPLFTWLPDAMAGPTPVSALIHAATMVTAGIYMVLRSNVLYTMAPDTLEIIAWVGLATAFLGATIGLFQNDIKKVLAYSTVSQLGYMFLALGVMAYSSSMFHVLTHAFFKALLFLAAGSVIHAMSGEQDIRRMGGLRKALPITFLTFLIGCIAISGVPPFSGFFSKDEILAHVYMHSKAMYFIGVLTSMMTAFYMFRLLFLTFFGNFRGTEEQKHHLHESPVSMTMPLIVLAILAVVGGFMGLPAVFADTHQLASFMAPLFELSNRVNPSAGAHQIDHATEYLLMGISAGAAVLSIIIAYVIYVSKRTVPAEESAKLNPVHNLVYNKYYIDELYNSIVVRPLHWLSVQFHKVVDVLMVDGMVNGVGKLVVQSGRGLRYMQHGSIGIYILAMVVGIIAILFFTLIF